MRLPGYCERCRKPRPVKVSGHAMAMLRLRGTVTGICVQCEREEDEERRKRWERRR